VTFGDDDVRWPPTRWGGQVCRAVSCAGDGELVGQAVVGTRAWVMHWVTIRSIVCSASKPAA